MEKKKLVDIANGVGKTAKDAFNKTKNSAVKIIDQNDDGKLDLADVSVVKDAVKTSVENAKKIVDENKKEIERKTLRPIFEDDISDAAFSLPKLIRIAPIDKKRSDSIICEGSIGYMFSQKDQKDFQVINIYPDNIGCFNISLFPNDSEEFYYVDPSDRNRYIGLDEYFSYLKQERIAELQKLAQDLGAKHFRVTYKEAKTSFSSKRIQGGIKAKGDNASAETSKETTAFSDSQIAAEMDCPGHAPIMPTLKYLQNDPNAKSLINLRMDEKSPLSHQHYVFQLSSSAGIKEKDALKIDAVLKELKCSGNATVANEVRNESRRYLEYDIDF